MAGAASAASARRPRPRAGGPARVGGRRRSDARHRTRRRLLATAGLALAVAGCGAGQLAQTSEVTSAVDGASGQAGSIALRNVAIGYPEGGQYANGSPARVEFVVVNEGADDDTLVDVRTAAAERTMITTGSAASGTSTPTGTESATATPTGTGTASPPATGTGSASPTGTASPPAAATASPTPEPAARIPVPAAGLVAFRADGPAVTLVGLTAPLRATQVVEITFVFERAGEVTLRVPVAAATEEVSRPPTIDVGEPEGEG